MLATSKTFVEVDAVVFPRCSCGLPMAAHKAPGCDVYHPVRPIEDHGTVAFESRDRLANVYWRLERLFHRLRRARLEK